MTPTVAFVLLLLGTILWFLLPLIPALRELLRPTDIMPLQVVGRDAADVALFARGFHAYLGRQLGRLPTDAPEELVGRLPDGTPFVRGRRLPDPLAEEARREEGLDRLVVLLGAGAFSGGETFLREVHATAGLAGGPGSTYRAVLGDASLTLGPSSAVLRWVHARGELLVGDGSLLAGRASSDQAIRLGNAVTFDRLAAPRIVVAGGSAVPDLPPAPAPTSLDIPPDRSRMIGDHLRVEGDLTIPPGAALEGYLVVTGSLVIGAGARVTGNLKAHGDIAVGDGASVQGALVARGAVRTGLRVRVSGPVVAEVEVRFGPGSVVGDATLPTSIAAPRVTLNPGVTLHGLVTATEGGHTTTDRALSH